MLTKLVFLAMLAAVAWHVWCLRRKKGKLLQQWNLAGMWCLVLLAILTDPQRDVSTLAGVWFYDYGFFLGLYTLVKVAGWMSESKRSSDRDKDN